jgi:hypothetical protein
MKRHYVVDTNVLIAGSAGNPGESRPIEATPDDPVLQRRIFNWLVRFEEGDCRLILDYGGGILKEYRRSRFLDEGSYGLQVVLHKWNDACDLVSVTYDADGNGVLPEELEKVVHDKSDRKMVAAALAARQEFGDGCVAFAGDSDWHEWEDSLVKHEVLLEPIVEEWSRRKHKEKFRSDPRRPHA